MFGGAIARLTVGKRPRIGAVAWSGPRVVARRWPSRPDDVAAIGERRCRALARGRVSSARDHSHASHAHALARRSCRLRTRRRPTGREAAAPHPGTDPDGGSGDVHELLKAAVDEAARLLDADGAMVYLIDPATGHLRFAHDAGIRSRRSRNWVRSIDLPGRRRDVRAGRRRAGGRR